MRYVITPLMRTIFNAIEDHEHKGHGIPGYRDLAAELDITNHTTVRDAIHSLRQRGWVDWVPKARGSLCTLPDVPGYFYPSQYKPSVVANIEPPDGPIQNKPIRVTLEETK